MNENLAELSNCFDHLIGSEGKNDFFYRRVRAINSKNENNFVNEVNQMDENNLIQTILTINPNNIEETELLCQKLHLYYSQNTFHAFSEKFENIGSNNVISYILQLILSESNIYIKFGLKCFIAIFCHPTFIFPKYFAETIIIEIKDHVKSDDMIIVQYALHIISKISSTSKNLAMLVMKYIDPVLIQTLICSSIDPSFCAIKEEVILQSLFIIGNYCFSIPTTEISHEFVDIVCQISSFVLNKSSNNCQPLQQSVLYCCAIIAKRMYHASGYDIWFSLFQQYKLFDNFNYILVNSHSAHERYYILTITKYFYKDSSKFNVINMLYVINLMNHQNSAIQATAIQCVSECSCNNEMLEFLINNGIISLLCNILVNGTRRGKIASLPIFKRLILFNPGELSSFFLKNNYIPYFLDLIQIVSEKSLEILLTILVEMNRALKLNNKQQYFLDILGNYDIYDQVYDLIENPNEPVSCIAKIFSSEIYL